MAPKTAKPAGLTLTAQAPCRADLAGGTVDLWPLYLFHPGALTLNFALEIPTTCRITPLAGPRIELRSLDTGREENFADLAELNSSKKPRHLQAACAVRFFAPEQGLRRFRIPDPGTGRLTSRSAPCHYNRCDIRWRRPQSELLAATPTPRCPGSFVPPLPENHRHADWAVAAAPFSP